MFVLSLMYGSLIMPLEKQKKKNTRQSWYLINLNYGLKLVTIK